MSESQLKSVLSEIIYEETMKSARKFGFPEKIGVSRGPLKMPYKTM